MIFSENRYPLFGIMLYASRSHFCMKLFLAAPASALPLLPTALT
jgi:hypothetical protein